MTKQLFTRFTISTLIMGILLIVLQQILLNTLPEVISTAFSGILIFFIIISLTFHYYIIKYAIHHPKKFVNIFLGGTTLKLLIYFSSMLIIVFTTNLNAKIFILNFAFLYLFFTLFELLMVLKQLKKIQSNNLKNTDLSKKEQKK